MVASLWNRKSTKSYKILNFIITQCLNLIACILPTKLEIKGRTSSLPPSAFITCNHYNQLDILPIKRLALRNHKRLYFIVKDTNLVMHFPIGFLVRNADSIPLTYNTHYLGRELPKHLSKIINNKSWILIYPEQELWFNYRKPRPLAKGAYYYAAKLNVPIISCFVEMQNRHSKELFHRQFYKQKLTLHILDTIYPDPKLTISQNTKLMMQKDCKRQIK
ncbi:1-acyl-sn-glycerol-3-phosphate acyltransferase [Lactobacillus hamsteri]